MNITLDEHDRIVLHFYGGLPYCDRDAEVFEGEIASVFLVYNDVDEVYSVLHRKKEDTTYEMGWRGTFESCIEHFTGLVSDLEIEQVHTSNLRWKLRNKVSA